MEFISKILNQKDPIFIMPFGGYANNERFICRARVLEDEGIEYTEDDGRLRNIWNSFKRFESDEISDMLVHVELPGGSTEAISDEEGYIEIASSHNFGPQQSGIQWAPITLSLKLAGQAPFEVNTTIARPGENCSYGVISDVDDTVMYTGVSSRFKWKLLLNSVAAHTFERTTFSKAAEFYTALHKGVESNSQNPIFYVSNSPWNLHEYISTFLRHQGFPEGPLLLRDFGTKHSKGDHPYAHSPKYLHIKQILEMYPQLPFILIGDAGELDADIYLHIAEEFPQRITAIYIRNVESEKRTKRVSDLILEKKDFPIHQFEETEEAMKHARIIDLIA